MAKTAIKKASVSLTAQKKAALHKVETSVSGLSEVRAYARKIWLAGLGAYAKVGSEGVDYFKELVKAGEGVEKRGKQLLGKEVEAANEKIETTKGSVTALKGKVGDQLDRVESAFDNRVASTLGRFGMATRQDVDALSAKLDQLSAALDGIARKP